MRLSGTVALDRTYALANGFISDQGGGLISNNGGSVGAPNPAGILANHGASLTGKVKLLANNGAGVIANNGAGYRLAQTIEAGAAPVGGMLVAAYSLALGGYLPIGKDADGKPVHATVTDAKGQYTLELPAGAGTNVMIVASAPGATDRRLAVDLVLPAQGGTAPRVDARTTVVSAFLRRTAEGWLEENLGGDPCRPAPEHLSGLVLANVAALHQTYDIPAFEALHPAARRYVIARMVEQALAAVSLSGLTIIPGLVPDVLEDGPALPALEGILAQLEAAAATKLAANPRYFDDKQYVLAANLRRRADQQLAIRTPADIGGFVVEVYMATADTQVQRSFDRLLLDLGLDVAIRNRMRAAGASVLQKLMPAFAADETRAAAQAMIAEAAKEAAPVSPDPADACPTPPPLPYDVDVTTLAGAAGKGFQDGPAAGAKFLEPVGLAVDAANRLLVAEATGRRIRTIDLADPAHPVKTLAGTGEAGDANGLASAATFVEPAGLALGGPGQLYIADRGGNRVRLIFGYDTPMPQVGFVAGDGTAGYLDGAPFPARFKLPTGLARAQDGSLYIVDEGNYRIRRLSPGGAIETVAGSGTDASVDGTAMAAAFNTPRGAAVGPDGALYVAEFGDDKIRRVGPEGVTTFAGAASRGTADGPSDRATFAGPIALAWLADGSLIVADAVGHRVRLLDPAGYVYTLAGGGPWQDKAEPDAVADGPGATARFNRPSGLAVGPDGTIYVADAKNHRIRAIRLKKRG